MINFSFFRRGRDARASVRGKEEEKEVESFDSRVRRRRRGRRLIRQGERDRTRIPVHFRDSKGNRQSRQDSLSFVFIRES